MAGRYGMRKEPKHPNSYVSYDTPLNSYGTMPQRGYSSRENYIAPRSVNQGPNNRMSYSSNLYNNSSAFDLGSNDMMSYLSDPFNDLDDYSYLQQEQGRQREEEERLRREEEERLRRMHETYTYDAYREEQYLSNDVYNPNNATYNLYTAPSYTATQYSTSYTDYSTSYTDYSTSYTDYSTYYTDYSTYYS